MSTIDLKEERFCTLGKDKDGYLLVCLGWKENKKVRGVHRLVAETFIPNPDNKLEVNHIDGNKTNNCVTNLEWCTRQENIDHSIRMGLIGEQTRKYGEENHSSKLTQKDVDWIRTHYIKGDKEFGGCGLAKKFNVSIANISLIVNNKSWRKVDE